MSALDLSYFLTKRSNELKLSATHIAKKAGISRQTWYRLINADIKQARIETLMRVADVLHVSLVELSCLYTNSTALQRQGFIDNSVINDACSFIRDVTYPFNAIVKQGEKFEKKWEIINLGRKVWENRRLICIDETLDIRLSNHNTTPLSSAPKKISRLLPQNNSVDIPLTAPKEHRILSIPFYSPKKVGTVISFWKMVDVHGNYCFSSHADLSCQVRVVNG